MIPPPRSPGFTAVVCTPALLEDGTDVLAALRPVVRRARGAVLISSTALGPPGSVLVVGRLADGSPVGPVRWFGPLGTPAAVAAVADWLDIGGPLAPLPPEVVALLALPSHVAA